MGNMGRFRNWFRDKISILNQRKGERRKGQIGERYSSSEIMVGSKEFDRMHKTRPKSINPMQEEVPSGKKVFVDRRGSSESGMHDVSIFEPSEDRRRKKPNK